MPSVSSRTVRSLAAGFSVLALSAGVLSVPANAAPPAAALPSVQQGQEGVRLHTNAELARALKRIERASHGRVHVRSIGTSNQGRPIWFATVGTGSTRLMYVTQQHGDEPLATESALDALRTLGLKNDRASRHLRSRVTLGIVVRANPDGHHHQWRYNYDPGARPEYGEPGKGYDINRYHDPAVRPEDNPVPEAAAIQRRYESFRPAVMVDYHMQGRYAFPPPDGREITTSILWPTNPAVPAAALKRSKQVGVRVYDAFTKAGAVVSQYPGGSYEGIARNAYGLRGGGSLLVELSALPPERERFQVRTAYVSMVDLVHAAAAGTLDRIDPARADRIPPRGPSLPDDGSASSKAAQDHDHEDAA
ncbi:M14 family zinc carboxypeptidase [Spirillospora sp. NPDC029432]|uniref:M14 family zinc carboxypeptidase n=1 Tax=Spirillospora sp. NPDC029432 TaxID=3154599 RepID=UPI00345411D0